MTFCYAYSSRVRRPLKRLTATTFHSFHLKETQNQYIEVYHRILIYNVRHLRFLTLLILDNNKLGHFTTLLRGYAYACGNCMYSVLLETIRSRTPNRRRHQTRLNKSMWNKYVGYCQIVCYDKICCVICYKIC